MRLLSELFPSHKPRPVRYHWLVLLLAWLSLWSTPAAAQEAIALPQPDHTIELGFHIAYLKDPGRNLSLAEVRQRQADFKPANSEVLNLGYTSAGYWVRFRLKNTRSEPLTRYLEFRSPFVDVLRLYAPGSDDSFNTLTSGRLLPPPERPHEAHRYVFPITIPANSDGYYYLYGHTPDTLTIPLYLHTDEGLDQALLTNRAWLTFYQGLIVAMTVFSFFLLVTLRDRVYGYYICAIVLHQGAFFTLFNGLGYTYFGLESPWWTREALSVLVCLAMWMIMQFARVLLKTRQEQPRTDQLIALTQYAALLVAALSIFLDYYVSIRLANPIASTTALILWFAGWNSYRSGNPAARYFLMAWTMLIVGGLAYSLKPWGLVPSNLFTEHGWQIGSAVEAILLSMAIAERINTETRQRMALQHEAQAAQARTLDIQRQANETLEQKVQERTEELEEANRKLQQLSDTDQLTGISNRRSLERHLTHAFNRARVDQKPRAVLLIDVDHFKPINDSHGHQVGDDCLVEIARRIQVNSRWPADLAARYGGEEFCVVLPHVDGQTALQTAERIRGSVANAAISTRIGPLDLTISVGVHAAVPQAGDTVDDFLKRADQALYQAKQEGRNQVTAYGAPAKLC
ncbi:sensor domain-containing diguanylate cyclase [Marinobacter salicampi]|uniref:sensor domain-containing diguanylate cyclase n=1 Tax=Marinobacter salicampi TaxID=435907 RepID=UPI00140A3215|nr:diguanylate cyclase [Marinobacter salicampi]